MTPIEKALEEMEPMAFATHHDVPMLFPTHIEAELLCDDDEEPVALYTADQCIAAHEAVVGGVAAELAEDMKKSMHDIANLIPEPADPKLKDWPCANPADRECLNDAYVRMRAALSKYNQSLKGAKP